MTQHPGREDIIRLLGLVSDHTVVEILALDPAFGDLETVAVFIAQEDDVLGEARIPLSGKAARIYDILMRDPSNLDDDRA